MIDHEKVPLELKKLPQWVDWRTETRKNKTTGEEKQTKVLKNPRTRGNASSTRASTWGSYEEAVKAYQSNHVPQFDGIGFVFAENDGYTGVDLDKCRDVQTGVTEQWALEIIKEVDSYAEVSPSGTGWHIITRSKLQGQHNKIGHVEMYDHSRYFTITGNLIPGVGRSTIETRDLGSLEERFQRGELGPQSSNGTERKSPRRDETESGEDWRILDQLAKELGTQTPDALEAALRQRYPERHAERNRVKRNHAGKTYWRYTIDRWFERCQRAADRSITEAEQALTALEADKNCEPNQVIGAIATVSDPSRRELLVGRLIKLRIPGVTRKFIERHVGKYRDEAEAERTKITAAARLSSLRALGESISGAELLDATYRFLRRFVLLSESQARAVALWAVHTYVFSAFDCTPYLAITSAEKQSGKTRLLEVLETLTASPWLTGAVSEAVLYRKIHAEHPTLLLDESDAAFNGAEEYAEALRAVLNTGFQKIGKASRCVGKGAEMSYCDFSTFCPKAIAGIGKLPDTVADRAIPIRLKRAARNEHIERFRRRDVAPEAAKFRNRIEAWATWIGEKLQDARPKLPDALTDRQQDGVEPLLAIADAASGEWPDLARRAVVELCAEGRASEDSNGVRLLSDVRAIFRERGVERLSSEDLASALAEIDASPWGEWSHGKPITKSKLARLLGKFGITSRDICFPDNTVLKGYEKPDFADAWSRYLPPETPPSPDPPVSKRDNATGPINTSENVNFEKATGVPCSESENAPNLNKNAVCSAVAFQKPETGEKGREKDL